MNATTPTLFDDLATTSGPTYQRLTCPAWVLHQLHRHGLPGIGHDQRAFSTTGKATPYWHHGSPGRPACGQPILAGDAWPWSIVLDPTPTTVDGELFALLSGRVTVELEPGPGWYSPREIWRRTPHMIATANADTVPVFVSHICGGPYPIVNNKWAPPANTLDTTIPF